MKWTVCCGTTAKGLEIVAVCGQDDHTVEQCKQ
jgi:hypothetical protein